MFLPLKRSKFFSIIPWWWNVTWSTLKMKSGCMPWEEHDSTDYLDWEESRAARFPKLKPTTKSISIRLPQDLIDDLKILAHKRDVPYQSLLKIFLAEKIEEEFEKKRVEWIIKQIALAPGSDFSKEKKSRNYLKDCLGKPSDDIFCFFIELHAAPQKW